MRATASRTAAIFSARTALSTTARRRQRAARTELFDRLEVEVLEDRSGLARRERRRIADCDRLPVAKDPVGECGRRLVEQDEVNRSSRGFLEARGERAQSRAPSVVPATSPSATSRSECGASCARPAEPNTSA
jgi:hypothetical protein